MTVLLGRIVTRPAIRVTRLEVLGWPRRCQKGLALVESDLEDLEDLAALLLCIDMLCTDLQRLTTAHRPRRPWAAFSRPHRTQFVFFGHKNDDDSTGRRLGHDPRERGKSRVPAVPVCS